MSNGSRRKPHKDPAPTTLPPGRDISALLGPIPGVLYGQAKILSIKAGRPKSSWQQQRVITHLAEMYPNGVPADVQRKWLLRELGRRDPALARLDLKTLRRAICTYTASRGCGGGD